MDELFINLVPNFAMFDLYTGLSQGSCYDRFYTFGDGDSVRLQRPVVHVGRFKGTFPLKIQAAGILEGQFLNKEFVVPENEILVADTLLRKTWFGVYVQNLERAGNSNAGLINSLDGHVLSLYTVFRCLWDTVYICKTCEDETKLTGVNPDLLRDSTLSAFPNPFRESVQIRIKNTGAASQDARLDILNLEGRLVHSFNVALTGDETLVQWDGKTGGGLAVPAGIYIANLKTAHQSKTLKLVKQP